MFILMFIVFVVGYFFIAQEHLFKIDKAAIALITGVIMWTCYVIGAANILPGSEAFGEFLLANPAENMQSAYISFIAHHEIAEHLAEVSEIIVFLLAAMTIVELIDAHEGFRIITEHIKTTKKVKLLWILCIISFFMSAILDNLTTSIVMITLLKKLVTDNKRRWFFASMIIIAANAGGAWSPIGDVTTIMLWIGGNVTAGNIISRLILPSALTILVPLLMVSFRMKGNVTRPRIVIAREHRVEPTNSRERHLVFYLGVALLMMVPVFKTITGLPPFMGMLGSLGILWIVTEVLHKRKNQLIKSHLTVVGVLKKVDFTSILFFLGILLAVGSLQSAGHLKILSAGLDKYFHNVYAINLTIGVLSAIVDNVPLVAGAMGMYDVAATGATGYMANFMQDGSFWELLAYCAGTGGSILIIGSAAGVVVMGMLNINFNWYFKRIAGLALMGYLSGVLCYYLCSLI